MGFVANDVADLDPPVSNSTKAQTSFERSDASPETALCTCSTALSSAILSMLGRYKCTPYRSIGKCGGTKVRVPAGGNYFWGCAKMGVGCRNEI